MGAIPCPSASRTDAQPAIFQFGCQPRAREHRNRLSRDSAPDAVLRAVLGVPDRFAGATQPGGKERQRRCRRQFLANWPTSGFVAQETPTYAGMSNRDHLWLGARMSPSWDEALAEARIDQHRLDPRQKAGKLSGGRPRPGSRSPGLAAATPEPPIWSALAAGFRSVHRARAGGSARVRPGLFG